MNGRKWSALLFITLAALFFAVRSRVTSTGPGEVFGRSRTSKSHNQAAGSADTPSQRPPSAATKPRLFSEQLEPGDFVSRSFDSEMESVDRTLPPMQQRAAFAEITGRLKAGAMSIGMELLMDARYHLALARAYASNKSNADAAAGEIAEIRKLFAKSGASLPAPETVSALHEAEPALDQFEQSIKSGNNAGGEESYSRLRETLTTATAQEEARRTHVEPRPRPIRPSAQ